MRELYERKDADRILAQAIRDAGGKVEFYRLHGIPNDEDVLKNEKVLAALNLRRVEAFERIEK